VVLSVTPPLAKGSGGTMITITGRGFQDFEAGTATVTIAGGTATNVQVVDDRTITAMTGAVTAGTKPFTPVDLVLSNANGSSTIHNFQVTSKGLLAIERCCAQRVFHIDTATGTVSQIGNLPRFSHGCALSPSGQMFLVTRDATNSQAQLNTWDPLSGQVNMVGLLNDAGAVNHNMTAMTFVGTTLYGLNTARVGTNTGRLATINPANGQVTIIGAASTGVGFNAGIAIKDANTVYVADQTNQSLDTIAVATSVVTTGLPITGGTNVTVHGLVNVAGTLYLSEQNSPTLVYTLNIGTGALTKIATIQNNSIASMCETPPSF